MLSHAQDKIYVHVATSSNINGNVTNIDHPDLNNNPNAGVVFNHSRNPNGQSEVVNDNISGIGYNSVNNKWYIYNENSANNIVINSSYNVYIANNSSNVITHVSNSSNESAAGNFASVIDHPLLNNNEPGPIAILSNYFTPNSVYNNYNYGFYYDISNKRGIYNEDNSIGIPNEAAFKILTQGDGVETFRHLSDASNTSNSTTMLDHPSLNGNPDATFVFSNYYGADGTTAVTSDHVKAAYYDNNKWYIVCEDASSIMSYSLTFEIIVAPQELLSLEANTLGATVQIFPNPSQNEVNIKSNKNIISIEVYDLLGHKLDDISVNQKKSLNINISNYPSGNYFIKVKSMENTQTLKLIKT